MKIASQLKDLEQFGIRTLTGEADALGFRILCDLDLQGVQVFKECFGMPCVSIKLAGGQITHDNGLAKNWNSGAIASVMLTGHDVVPLAVIGFYLQGKTVLITRDRRNYEAAIALDDGEQVLIKDSLDGYLLRYNHEADEMDWPELSYGKIIRIIRQKNSDGQIVQGTRNVHQMSGRVQ